MYQQFYNLNKIPFSKGIPTSCLYQAGDQVESLQRLKYAVQNNLFAVVTGECGSGKSTLLRNLKDSMEESKSDFLYIADSQLTPRHFYNGILRQLGRDGAFYRGDARLKLHQEIELLHGVRGREIAIVVDEAHLLDKEMLEELRFVLNFKMDSESPLSLILSGQTELEDILYRKSSTAIRQRVDIHCRLRTLNLEETKGYIKHQLAYAGSQETIFSESAVEMIFGYSSGSTRLINKACNSCLVFGCLNELSLITDVIAKDIIESELK
jgi:type II secretory pathway predicted ATPase ExeA